MVKDPGKVIKMHGGGGSRKVEASHTAAKKIPMAQDHKTSDHRGSSGPPKSPPKKEK
jgi:hypothetical protein